MPAIGRQSTSVNPCAPSTSPSVVGDAPSVPTRYFGRRKKLEKANPKPDWAAIRARKLGVKSGGRRVLVEDL